MALGFYKASSRAWATAQPSWMVPAPLFMSTTGCHERVNTTSNAF